MGNDREMSQAVFAPEPALRNCRSTLFRPDSRGSQPRPDGPLNLDKNENTDPELAALYARLLEGLPVRTFSTYPDLGPLYQQLANWLKVPSACLYLTTGCDGAIQRTLDVFVNPGDGVLITQPSFAMYPIYAQAYAAEVHFLKYRSTADGPALDVLEVLDALRALKPRVFCLPNPDSPTGTVFAEDDLAEIANVSGATGTLLLVDEAYHPFSQVTAQNLVLDMPHVLIARTFSKAWGLAGFRAGYLLGHPETIEWFHRTRPMYEIGEVANQVLLLATADPSAMTASVDRLNAGRDYFADEMLKMSLPTIGTGGNFVHVAFGRHGQAVHSALAGRVLYRQDSSDDCLRGFSRFTSTTVELFEPIVDDIRRAVLNTKGI